MTNSIKKTIVFAFLAAGAAHFSCSDDRTLAGAGSETTNGIVVVGSVRNTDGTPAHNTVVKMFSSSYKGFADGALNPSADTTDPAGAFRFNRVDSGLYTFIARNPAAATSTMLAGLHIGNGDSVVTAPLEDLKRPGNIAVDLSGGADTSAEYVFIPGTDLFARVGAGEKALLGDVPAGIVPNVSYATGTGEVYGIRSDVSVTSLDTIFISHAAWKYRGSIVFNTSAGGAGVGKDVYDFPVLVRLTADNFKFQEAQPDGRDIRFVKSDDSFAPFEIERWDASAGRAEIWVKIDTLRGNSAAQTLSVLWGNPHAAAASAPGAVFDTAQGFQGVWHFGETSADSARDATSNHFDGVSGGTNAAPIAGGVIGACREFDGAASCVTMPNTAEGKLNFPQNGAYTISAWVRLDTLDSASYVVVSKGAFQYYLWYTVIYQNTPNWEFVEYEESAGWKCPTHPARAGEWTLLTGVSNGTSQLLYVDGEPADTSIVTYSYTEPRNTTTDFIVGRYITKAGYPPGKLGGYCCFDGKIDEVRACSRSRSAEWIRLCYMNQRADDKLVVFK